MPSRNAGAFREAVTRFLEADTPATRFITDQLTTQLQAGIGNATDEQLTEAFRICIVMPLTLPHVFFASSQETLQFARRIRRQMEHHDVDAYRMEILNPASRHWGSPLEAERFMMTSILVWMLRNL